jgi:hypothetical protein
VLLYSEIRSTIEDGDVFTFSGPWLFSKLIRYWTKQEVSHAGLAVWINERLFILEAMDGIGLRFVPLSHTFREYGQVFWQKNLTSGRQCLEWALNQWGVAYPGKFRFLSIMSPRLRGWIKPHGLHCAGLVAGALQEAGFDCPKEPEYTSPGDLWDFRCLSLAEEICA